MFLIQKMRFLGAGLLLCTLAATVFDVNVASDQFTNSFEVIITFSAISILLLGVLQILSGKILWKGDKFLLPLLLLFLYVAWRSNLDSGVLSLKGLYFLALLTIFAILPILQPDQQIQVYLFFGILTIGLIECGLCLLQLCNLYNSPSILFKISGSWVNPNVTAMFLVMTVPVAGWLTRQNKISRGLFILYLLLSLLCIILLKCRTCVFGIIIFSLLQGLSSSRFNAIIKKHRTHKLAVILALGVGMMVICIFLFNAKSSSSFGRLFIWKLSTQIALSNPITGIGLGKFEKVYNLEQASYFQRNGGSKNERTNAAHINVAYNDPLELLVEGGAILICLVLVTLLVTAHNLNRRLKISKKRSSDLILIHGVMMFAIMGFMNFAFQAVPAALICVILYSTISGVHTPIRAAQQTNDRQSKFRKNILGGILVVTGVACLTLQLKSYHGDNVVKRAQNSFQAGQYDKARNLLIADRKITSTKLGYYQILGKTDFINERFDSAIIYFNLVNQYSSSPENYLFSGFCYQNLHDFEKARYHYQLAADMEPSHLSARYYLMNLYLEHNLNNDAVQVAKSIVETTPKVNNNESAAYKAAAMKILNNENL